MPPQARRRLSESAREELLALACLDPYLEADLRAPLFSKVGATDASLERGGACEAEVKVEERLRLYDIAEGKGEHVRLGNTMSLPDLPEATRLAEGVLITVPQQWKTTFSFKFKQPSHIILLELTTPVTYIKRVVKQGLRDMRIIVLVDSAVVKGRVTKGRSSARSSNFGLRQLAGYFLAHNLYVEVWVPTWANPADSPSRGRSLAYWRKEAEPLWEVVRRGFNTTDYASLAEALRAGKAVGLPLEPPDTECLEAEAAADTFGELEGGLGDWADPQLVVPTAPTSAPPAASTLVPGCTTIQTAKPKTSSDSQRSRWGVAELFSLWCGALDVHFEAKGFQGASYELYDKAGERLAENDLADPSVVRRVCRLINGKHRRYIHLGTPCSSFSVLQGLFGKALALGKGRRGRASSKRRRRETCS